MHSLGEAIRRRERVTAEEWPMIEEVLELATAWADGEVDLLDAARVGRMAWKGRPSPGYTRAMAMAMAEPGDPRREDLKLLVDRLLTMKGSVITDFGVFGKSELLFSDSNVRRLFPDREPVRPHSQQEAGI
jgi:hypothetical protein